MFTFFFHQLFAYLWCPPSEENISETRLPASDIVSLSKFIIGESFMETHSRPLEAVGLHDRLKGCESENRPRRRSPYSKSTDFERFKTSTILKKYHNLIMYTEKFILKKKFYTWSVEKTRENTFQKFCLHFISCLFTSKGCGLP